MKNDFQQHVDQRLSSVEWNELRSRRVLNCLHEQKRTVRPRLAMVMAAVLALVMLTATAFAMLAVNRAPEAEAVHTARQTLMDKYGLTADTLGAFYTVCEQNGEGWTVTFRSPFRELAGEYTVTRSGERVTASWTHDAADPALYLDGSLDAPVWGQTQLEAAVHDKKQDAWARIAALPTITPAATPLIIAPDADTGSVWMATTPAEAKPGDITAEEATAIAAAAIREELGLDETIPVCDECSWALRQDAAGQRMFEFSVTVEANDMQYCVGVFVNAETGTVVSLEYDTVGNG